MQRRIAATLVVAAGVLLIATTFVDRLWSRTPAFERLSKDFRPIMTEETLSTARSDLAALDAGVAEFASKAIPTLAPAFGMTPEQFTAFIAARFPAVAAGVQAVPRIVPQVSGLIGALDAERARFASADEIPTKSIPSTAVPWAILAAGIAVLVAGFGMLTRTRAAPVFAAVLGVALVAVTLGLSETRKAADYDTMNRHLSAVYTPQTVAASRQALDTVSAMAADLQGKMLPLVAQRLGIPPEQVIGTLGSQFPALTAGLGNFIAASVRFDNLVSTLERDLADSQTVSPLAFQPVAWTLVGSGIGILLAGAYSLGAARMAEIGVHPSRAQRRAARGRRAA